MYADFQDPIGLIISQFNEIEKGYDMVWGERSSTAYGVFEKMFSELYAKLMRQFVDQSFPSKGFDVVMFNQKVKQELDKNPEKNSSIFLQMLLLGFKQSRIEYSKVERKKGKSKWTFQKRVKLFIDSFVGFSYFPIKMVSIFGIIFFVLGMVWLFCLIVFKVIGLIEISGWTSVMVVLLLGFGISNIGLGIVAEYLWRTLDVSRNRPNYIVDKIYKLSE